MLIPGDYSDAFRSLGQLLEQAKALEVRIVDQGPFLEVSWSDRQGNRQDRQLREEDLAALRTTGSLYRGTGPDTHRFGASDLLRSLGQRLDRMGLERVSVVETQQGFSVGGRTRGQPVTRSFSFSDLVSLAEELRRGRDAVTPSRFLGTADLR
jgi:hypothetical protein